ncbi:hypothetical protein ACFC1R_01825 [Kitasatospora sp. NPDC056138]|uniref:hypothetical protein n=1 Tax=Kitasatospora sp. NPDC056138 TaxID=3345724 RepID=UPI0035DF8E0B
MPGFAKNVLSALSTRRSLAIGFAALTVGAAVPLFPGASAAWACGDDGAPAGVASAGATGSGSATAPSPAETHHGSPASAFIPVVPAALTAGGAPVEIGVEMANFTGADYAKIAPSFALYNPRSNSDYGTPGTNLRIQDLKVAVMKGGRWVDLPLRNSCDPTIVADTSVLADSLTDQHAHRYLFRLSLAADAPAQQTEIQVFSGFGLNGKSNSTTLKVLRGSAARTANSPARAAGYAAGSATDAASAVPAVLTPLPSVDPEPDTVPVGNRLAQSGLPGGSALPAGSAGAFVLLGGGAVVALRRRSAHR